MAYVKPKYEGEDFLEWYKTHYGKDYDGSALNRGEGMLDQDWEIGSALYGTYKDKLARDEQFNTDVNTLTNNYNTAQGEADRKHESDLGTLDSDYQKAQERLLENYNSSVSGLDKSKNQSLQSASITYDKLKKYLPTQIKAQGLGGLGVSESTMLQAHNNYATQTGSIKNNYNDNRMALDKAYNEGEVDLETAYGKDRTELINTKSSNDTERKLDYNEAMGLLRKYYDEDIKGLKTDVDSIVQNHKKKEEDRQNKVFENFEKNLADARDTSTDRLYAEINALDIDQGLKDQLMVSVDAKVRGNVDDIKQGFRDDLKIGFDEVLYYGAATSSLGVEKYINSLETNKDLFDDETYNYYKNALQTKYDEFAKKEAEEKQAETDKKVLEGKEYISYGGSQYKVKTQLNENSNEIGHNRNFTEQIKEKFGTTNPYDSKIPNGTVLTIKCDSKGKNEVNYEDFGLADVTDWRNWIPGYNIYNQITKWGNFETRHVAYYNGNWYLVDKK